MALSWVGIHAQRPEATFATIVIFEEGAVLQGEYQPDDRAQGNPAAWNYLNRGVAGHVQALERAGGFRAEHVYSAAVRGFSARLTARQIADFENDPSVAYVEPDGIMRANAQTLPWGIDRIDADMSTTQAGNGTGAIINVNSYIIDTGLDGALVGAEEPTLGERGDPMHAGQRDMRGLPGARSVGAVASGMTAIRVRPKPFGDRCSTPMATSTLPAAPRPRLPGLTPPKKVSSTSTSPDSNSRPGRTIAVRNRCSIAHAVW